MSDPSTDLGQSFIERAKLTNEEKDAASQRGLHPHLSWQWNEEDMCHAVADDMADAATAKALWACVEWLEEMDIFSDGCSPTLDLQFGWTHLSGLLVTHGIPQPLAFKKQ